MDRADLVAHLAEQIRRDPEAYANDAKLGCIFDKLAKDLAEQRDEG